MKNYINAFASDICYPLEEQNIDLVQEQFKHLKNLDLADRNPEGLPMNITILIGCQNYWDFIGYKQIRCEPGPVAIASRLGFVLSGSYENTKNVSNTSVKFDNSHLMKVESLLHESIKVKQDLSSLFQQKHINDFSPSQKDTLEFFDNTTVFENNRYEVKLPFKDEADVNLSNNYNVCKNRLKTLLNNTFKSNTNLLSKYDNIIKEQANLNSIEPVIDYQLNKTHYLPHRLVVKENRQTTKVRMVCDANVKGKSKISLNDTLNPGPSLKSLLPDVLLPFRSFN